MNETKRITIDSYDYALPDERIARYPLEDRAACQLLVYRPEGIVSTQFRQIADFIPRNALLVRNNTRVIRARIHLKKATGATIEVMCLDPVAPAQYECSLAATSGCSWRCLIGNARRWKAGSLETNVTFPSETTPIVFRAEKGEGDVIHFSWDSDAHTFGEILTAIGTLPIPPYLKRDPEERDNTDYQTIYAQCDGSVAAPTAGLHFTTEVFKSIQDKGIPIEEVTLHVGAGTFLPVKTAEIGDHKMHHEVCHIPRKTIAQIARGQYDPIIAVGTTSVRTLESLYLLAVNHLDEIALEDRIPIITQWEAYETGSSTIAPCDALQNLLNKMDAEGLREVVFSTALLIAPGYTYRIVEGIVTNFHQPKSTLLLMISSFVGEAWHDIYNYALAHDYRFLSYGDGSLLLPEKSSIRCL